MHRGGRHLDGSPAAGPCRPGPDGTREQIMDQYRTHLLSHPELLALLSGLRGRRLGEKGLPETCHAEIIAEPGGPRVGNKHAGASSQQLNDREVDGPRPQGQPRPGAVPPAEALAGPPPAGDRDRGTVLDDRADEPGR
ncbi:DUF4326 domain-containing protein [Streptomyces uncialis]|uniref:DUF4326 domain-containing protein n=1 Tax=Streptomyces uncialis TaxID=1048205 RepID=UPI00380389AD